MRLSNNWRCINGFIITRGKAIYAEEARSKFKAQPKEEN